jgi:hypothetical protein
MVVKVSILLIEALSHGLSQSQGFQGLICPKGDWRLAEIIGLVEPCSALDQETYQSAIPRLERHVHWGVPVLALGIDLCFFGYKEFGQFQTSVFCRIEYRGVADLIVNIHITLVDRERRVF